MGFLTIDLPMRILTVVLVALLVASLGWFVATTDGTSAADEVPIPIQYSADTFPSVVERLAQGAVIASSSPVPSGESTLGKIRSLEPWEVERVRKYLTTTEDGLRKGLASLHGRDSGDVVVQEREADALYTIALVRAERDVLDNNGAFALLEGSLLPEPPKGHEFVRVYAHRERARPQMVCTVIPVRISAYADLLAAHDRRLAISVRKISETIADWNSLPFAERQARLQAHQVPGGFDVDRDTLIMTQR